MMIHSHSFVLPRIAVDVIMIVKPFFRLLGKAIAIGLQPSEFVGALRMGSRFSINDERGGMSYRVGTFTLASWMKKAIFLSLIVSGLLLIGCGGGGGGGGVSSLVEALINATQDGGGPSDGDGSDNGNGTNGDGGNGNGNGTNGDGGSDNGNGTNGDGGNGNGNGTNGDSGSDNGNGTNGDGRNGNGNGTNGDSGNGNGNGGEPNILADEDNDGVGDADELMDCVLKPDCDGDGERDNVDIDDDGDGLIEIHNASELDAVRWVLDGIGFKANEMATLDQTGCGNSSAIRDCSGYELVRDISLSDHIARTNATAGWRPIASDVDGLTLGCQGDSFTAIFDGNGFAISGLFIDRSGEDCIGLFGQASGTIRHLGVIADKVGGNQVVGGLVGYGDSASIVHSYAVSGSVSGDDDIGGLVGDGVSTSIVHSYAVSGSVSGDNFIGGLMGKGDDVSIIQSYAVSGSVNGRRSRGGGLVGGSRDSTSIVHSYAVSGSVRGLAYMGGLVGIGDPASIIQSYAVTGEVRATSFATGGLVGWGGNASVSYWDTGTSGETNDNATGSSGQTTSELRSPTDYTGIYATWDDGAMVDGINDDTTIYCDEDQSSMIEDNERRGKDHAMGDNRIWHFGTATDYPAIRCTPDSLTDQRAWWHLNANNKPELDQDRLNAYLNGTLP